MWEEDTNQFGERVKAAFWVKRLDDTDRISKVKIDFSDETSRESIELSDELPPSSSAFDPVYVGPKHHLAWYFVTICRALEDGLNPSQLSVAMTDAVLSQTKSREKLTKEKDKDHFSSEQLRKYGEQLYDAFCARLALSRYSIR